MMMMILTLLLSLAVLALFVQSSSAWPDKQPADSSKGGRRAAGNDVRSRGKSGDFKSEGKRSDNRKSSYSAHLKAALSAEDEEEEEEEEGDRFQHNQNAQAVENHVVGLESRDSRLNLEGGAWKSQRADGSVEYMAFENKYTYKRVLRDARGKFDCGRHIYDQRHKNKNPSILYSSYYGDTPQATLIHKRTDDMFIEESVYINMTVTWTREASIPSDFRCFTASYLRAAESIGMMDREPLTWMGQNIGLYAAVESDQNEHWGHYGNLTVISELDGYTKTVISPIFPAYSQFIYVVASYNNTFWTICYCGGSNQLKQSNSNAPINVGFRIRGATALSESILFLFDDNNGRIVKYDVVNNQILAESSSGDVEDVGDLAISLDKKYVYYLNNDDGTEIIALNAVDLSFYRSYSISFPDDGDFGVDSIEVTPTNMWVVVTDWDVEQSYLASVTLNDN